nr:hypothetical protein GCM10020092_077360 [Actinoplanes digitatis]
MLTGMSIERPTIRIQGLEKSFKHLKVLRGVDIDVARGSIFALLGSNGAGKTTVVNILSTLLKADAGTALVNGFDVATQAADVRESISLTGQFAAVDEILTGRENLVMVARLRHLKGPGTIADAQLRRFSLTEAGDRRVATYSGGMRRRLDIAMSLIGNPPVIFLDEPTTGLDPEARLEVWQAVRELAAGGTTVLLTTQHLDEAEQLADRIAILHEGRIIVNGTLAELKKLLPLSQGRVHREAADPRGRLPHPRRRPEGEGTTMNRHFLGDTTVLLGRSLRHIARSPDTIITTAVMPIAFMLLFVYVLGGAIETGSDSYVNYLLPGILIITIASGISYTAYRLFLDMQGGIFARFQSMPIARASVLWAHVLTSLVANLTSLVVVVGVALLMGFRTGADLLEWLAVAGILVLFTLALTWIAVIPGLTAKSVDGASAFAYPLIFLPFISSAFVPTESMPGPVRAFAENQPVTSIVDAIRNLFARQPVGTGIWTALAWCAGIVVVAYLIATMTYRRKIS